MTTATSTHPQPRKQTTRPSVWRSAASYYVDLLICGFIAWIVCFTFGWYSYWVSLMLFLWVGEVIWCRDRLNPTAGEYCVGIRYLTSSSSQVVADIKVVHNKLKLNGFLLTAGIVELTLAILFFSGWTFLARAAFFTVSFGPPLSVAYWALVGFAFFLCSGYLLSASKLALWVVPAVHGFFMVDLFLSASVWKDLLQDNILAAPALLHAIRSQPVPLLDLFAVWTLFVFLSLGFSRKHLVN